MRVRKNDADKVWPWYLARASSSISHCNHHRPIAQTSTTTYVFTAKYLTLCDVGSCLEVTDQLRATDMCLLHTGFLCSTIEPVTTSPVWTGTGSSIINSTCFQWVVL